MRGGLKNVSNFIKLTYLQSLDKDLILRSNTISHMHEGDDLQKFGTQGNVVWQQFLKLCVKSYALARFIVTC